MSVAEAVRSSGAKTGAALLGSGMFRLAANQLAEVNGVTAFTRLLPRMWAGTGSPQDTSAAILRHFVGGEGEERGQDGTV